MTHEAQDGCPLRSVVSPLGPGSRYARPGHETGLRLAERERRDRCPHAPTPTLARTRHAVRLQRVYSWAGGAREGCSPASRTCK